MDAHEPASLERLSASLVKARGVLPEAWRNAPLGLCLSGGADSCALALATTRALDLAPEAFPTGIVAYHARHALRGSESDGDAASVRELCGHLGLALVEVDAAVPHGPDLEARARDARYAAIRACAGPSTLLATAHHRDDQTETVLLRLLRGAGPVGLRAIHPLRADGVWRPFLAHPRRTLEDACAEASWLPRQDSSNLDTSLARNALRHELIPVLEREQPGFCQAVAALAEAAQALEPYLERALERLSAAIELRFEPDNFRCDLSRHPDAGSDPELDLLLERAWSRLGRRPWAAQQRARLMADAASGSTGRRSGGQRELAIWGGKKLRVERRIG